MGGQASVGQGVQLPVGLLPDLAAEMTQQQIDAAQQLVVDCAHPVGLESA